MLGVDVKDKILSGRNVPEAAVDVDILNVSFGGVVYQSVTESEVSYIGRGAETQLQYSENVSSPGNYYLCYLIVIRASEAQACLRKNAGRRCTRSAATYC